MRLGRPVTPIVLTTDERETLERWARRPTTAQARALRARLVLRCAAGESATAIASD
ncbi:MAG: IS630 family transposase, partial [Acidobacteria bacterium]|nr:IS630 family transposase [Acidobacteriota bacterium]